MRRYGGTAALRRDFGEQVFVERLPGKLLDRQGGRRTGGRPQLHDGRRIVVVGIVGIIGRLLRVSAGMQETGGKERRGYCGAAAKECEHGLVSVGKFDAMHKAIHGQNTRCRNSQKLK